MSTDIFIMSESKLYFMTREQKVIEMHDFLTRYPGEVVLSTSHAIGGGEWSLEVGAIISDEGDQVHLFELIGFNGTNGSEPTDLHAQLRDIIAEAKELFPF